MPKNNQEESVFSHHEPCPKCGSKDNLSRYTSGWGICVCGYKDRPENYQPEPRSERMSGKQEDLLEGEIQALRKRSISEETCRKFGYSVGTDKRDKNCHIAPYYSGRTLVAQKIRYPDKSFKFVGDAKKADLFGQNCWGSGGKLIVITEGEIDALSVSQIQGNKWPVVSVPNGAQGASRSIKNSLEWLETFETVVLMFDMDEPGQNAAIECAPLFTPGKCKIASLPLKDANECLQKGQIQQVINAIWQAKPYRPEGLVEVDDLIEEALEDIEVGLPWCFPELTYQTYGRRYGEIYGVGAGTGVGKTDLLTQQIAYDINVLGLQVGLLFLEQKPLETTKRVAGKCKGKRFHIPHRPKTDSQGVEEMPIWTKAELKEGLEELKGKMTMFDSFGATDWSIVSAKIRYMAVAQDIKVFYLDHLTAMADTSREKESIEQIMKELAGLANELGIMVIFVSHLSTPEGKPHEEGGRVFIKHFKGSRAIGFWSYYMFGLERNQQAEDPEERQTTTLRILKDRYTGEATGNVILLGYERDTGMLFVKEQPSEDVRYKPMTEADAEEMF